MEKTDVRCMWIDPLAFVDDPRLQSGAVLCDDLIAEYVEYNLLIEKASFRNDNLKGASYSLTPAEDGSLIFHPDEEPSSKGAIKRGWGTAV